jgi:hypothetical protein
MLSGMKAPGRDPFLRQARCVVYSAAVHQKYERTVDVLVREIVTSTGSRPGPTPSWVQLNEFIETEGGQPTDRR